MSTPASRAPAPRPPEKGVFPLDHFGECKEVMTRYMACLKEHKNAAEPCRPLSKEYLECRMSKGLMAQEDLRALGFRSYKPDSSGASVGSGDDASKRR